MQHFVECIRTTFSTLTLSTMYYQIRVKNRSAEDAVAAFMDWNLKYGPGTAIDLQITTVPHLLDLVVQLQTGKPFSITPEQGAEKYGFFYGFMQQHAWLAYKIPKADALKYIEMFQPENQNKLLRQEYNMALAGYIEQYTEEFNLPPLGSKDEVIIFAAIAAAVIEYLVYGIQLDRNVLAGIDL